MDGQATCKHVLNLVTKDTCNQTHGEVMVNPPECPKSGRKSRRWRNRNCLSMVVGWWGRSWCHCFARLMGNSLEKLNACILQPTHSIRAYAFNRHGCLLLPSKQIHNSPTRKAHTLTSSRRNTQVVMHSHGKSRCTLQTHYGLSMIKPFLSPILPWRLSSS